MIAEFYKVEELAGFLQEDLQNHYEDYIRKELSKTFIRERDKKEKKTKLKDELVDLLIEEVENHVIKNYKKKENSEKPTIEEAKKVAISFIKKNCEKVIEKNRFLLQKALFKHQMVLAMDKQVSDLHP